MQLVKILAIIFSLAVVSAPAFADYEEEFHQTYPLQEGGVVNLKNINGDVVIRTWDRNEVKVDAVKRADTQQELQEAEIIIRDTPQRIDIKTDYDDDHNRHHRHNHDVASVEYTLTVPRQVILNEIELVNGDLTVEGVQGEVHLASVNGEVEARGLTNEAHLSTVNGTVRAEFAKLGQSVSLKSVNGTVNVAIPPDSDATIDAETLHGSISNDFGLNTDKHKWIGSSLNGKLGSGSQRIDINTVNGSIRIRKSS